jgi:hypothetical protein
MRITSCRLTLMSIFAYSGGIGVCAIVESNLSQDEDMSTKDSLHVGHA